MVSQSAKIPPRLGPRPVCGSKVSSAVAAGSQPFNACSFGAGRTPGPVVSPACNGDGQGDSEQCPGCCMADIQAGAPGPTPCECRESIRRVRLWVHTVPLLAS